MYGYIYKTTNLFNGKIYIGRHKSKKFDPKYFGSGYRILNIIHKYGTNLLTCELLQECYSEEELNEMERFWISKYHSMDRTIGYNLMDGGYKTTGIHHSDTTKEKISKSKMGHSPNRVYHVTEETKKKIKDSIKNYYLTHDNPKKGTHLSEETKEKLRQINLGKKYSEEVRAKHRRPAWNKGIPMSEESKKHLSEINTGKKQNLSEEVLERKRKQFLGKNNPNYGGLKECTRKKLSEAITGRVWINNGKQQKQVFPKDLETFILQGYIRGRLPFKHSKLIQEE